MIDELSSFLAPPIIQYYLSIVLSIIPLVVIYKRAGVHMAGVALAFIPYAGIVLCIALLGFSKWRKTNA